MCADHYNRHHPANPSTNSLPGAVQTSHTAPAMPIGNHVRRAQLLSGLIKEYQQAA